MPHQHGSSHPPLVACICLMNARASSAVSVATGEGLGVRVGGTAVGVAVRMGGTTVEVGGGTESVGASVGAAVAIGVPVTSVGKGEGSGEGEAGG